MGGLGGGLGRTRTQTLTGACLTLMKGMNGEAHSLPLFCSWWWCEDKRKCRKERNTSSSILTSEGGTKWGQLEGGIAREPQCSRGEWGQTERPSLAAARSLPSVGLI